MDLVDEQNIPVLEIREDGGQITGAFENRSGRGLDFHTKLVSDDVRKRGLTETRRSAEQHVIERFSPAFGGFYEYPQIVLDPVLTDKVLKADRPQAPVKLKIIIMLFGLYDSFFHDSLWQ
jgi:hypothetical protein